MLLVAWQFIDYSNETCFILHLIKCCYSDALYKLNCEFVQNMIYKSNKTFIFFRYQDVENASFHEVSHPGNVAGLNNSKSFLKNT